MAVFESADASIAYDFMPAMQPATQLLVLVNGYQRTRSDFRAIRKRLHALAPSTATISLDNRYCGETVVLNTTTPLTMEQMAKDVEALAKHYCTKLALPHYSLLGISMGGMIIQTLATHNQEVNKLFLISTTAGGKGRTWSTKQQNASIDPTKIKFKNNFSTLEETKKHMSRYFGSNFLQKSPLLFEMLCKNMVKESQSNNAETQFYVSLNFDGSQNLAAINAQTYIYSGDEDQVIPMENSNYLHQNIPNSAITIYHGAGHLLLIETPEQLAEDIARNLNS